MSTNKNLGGSSFKCQGIRQPSTASPPAPGPRAPARTFATPQDGRGTGLWAQRSKREPRPAGLPPQWTLALVPPQIQFSLLVALRPLWPQLTSKSRDCPAILQKGIEDYPQRAGALPWQRWDWNPGSGALLIYAPLGTVTLPVVIKWAQNEGRWPSQA